MSAVRGSVQRQVDGMEFLTRYSLNSLRHGSIISSLEDFREHERFSITDKQWNWKLLRDQFKQKNMESLYRRYDDKLRLGFLSIFLMIMVVMSITHLLTVIFTSSVIDKEINDELVAIICYSCQTVVPIPILAILFIERITAKKRWLQPAVSITVIVILVIIDTLVPVLNINESDLRPAYYTNTLLACYIFLPINNHLLALVLGCAVSIYYIVLLSWVTYPNEDSNDLFRELGGDALYLLGVNFLGIYYRVMNEIVSRRSFLDRRACVESTLKLNFEKEQEDRLLSSILPEHTISIMRKDIRDIFEHIQSPRKDSSPITSPMSSYITKHDNVSILYADIVNYTMISTTLPPKVLVETLNELFAKFDEAAEEHEVLRIKFLGDCYYCVSGVPKPNPQHAKSCVDLGLEMISIIKEVRENRKLNIDMRIGVHSGKILSGIIGIKKWQFDIWSKDATIANKMESTGKAGKVHITKRTLEELDNFARDYVIEPNFEAAKDPLLSKYKIETFLISNPSKNSEEYADHRIQYRRASVGMARRMRKGASRGRVSESTSSPRNRTTAFIDNNLMAYRQMLKDADYEMSMIIDQMPSGIWGGYTNVDTKDGEESPMLKNSLLFRKISWEKSFLKQPDLLFKYFVAASFIIFIFMISIQALTIDALTWTTWVVNGILALILVIMQPLNWTQYFWNKYKGREQPKNIFLKYLYNKSASIIWSATMRSVFYIFISTMLAISSLINLTECDSETPYDKNCIPPWHLAQVTFLALLLSFLFSRVFFVLKWAVGLIIMIIYILIVWDLKSGVFTNSSSWNVNMDLAIAHTLAIVFLTLTLLLIDRQTEFRRRLDYRWKRTLNEKQEDASTKKIVNNMLLHNILPAHVANLYLNTSRNAEELYFEEYDCVAVMFASLTDYRFTSDDGTETSEETLLKYLNQLISDFDKYLMSVELKRLKVEKIKMAGWTYMAACGLDTGQHRPSITSTSSSCLDTAPSTPGVNAINAQTYEEDVVRTMVQFAAAMNEILVHFNRSSFQGINLKIGICHGVVSAGVVGSSKPLYDIWGHAVNMASRMDSTGEPGKIQVTENTAIVLDRQGILTQYRGKPYVKGAGYIRTYFVPLDKDCNLIYKDSVSSPKLNEIEDTTTTTQL